MNQDQLRAKALALFHSLVSGWAGDLRKEVTDLQDELMRQLDALQERMAKYEENLDESRVLAFADEIARGGGAGGDGDSLTRIRVAMARLDEGRALQDVLATLVHELGQFAPRVALFVIKEGVCHGWNGQGFDQSPGFSNDALKRIKFPVSADTVFRTVINTGQSFLGDSSVHKENVQLLTRIGNILPSTIFASPLVIRDRVAAVVYADNADSREDLSGTEAIEILVSYASKVLDLVSGGARPSGRTATGDVHGRHERMEKLRQTTPPGARPPARPPAATPAPPAEEPPSGTVMFNARDLQGQAAPESSARPSPRVSEAPSQTDPQTQKQHEDAKRFARLLISEIKLYNESKVQQGRKSRELYDLLKDDIERSRQLYSERVPESVRATTNYFHEELVRILADGDTAAMGTGYHTGM